METIKIVSQGIYKIVNSQNDHFYIGSAVNLARRHTRHFSELRHNKHNNKHLQAAWNKYGESSFTFTTLEIIDSKEDLYAAEDKWLSGHVGAKYCYNIGVAAASPMLGLCGPLSPTWGYRHTNEARAKIAAAGIGRIVSLETRAKRSAATKGRSVSEEQKSQISRTLSGKGNFWYGKERSEGFKAKVRKAITVIDARGVETQYMSIQELRGVLGLKPSTVNNALKSGLPLVRGPHTGLSFKYLAPPATT